MRQYLSLFLGDREVEFSNLPDLLYNYTETDTTNPTVIKNSYSKKLTIEGTPHNNQIFGHIWNLERVQKYGIGSYTGSEFNPLEKASFTLFLNGEIYESGYFKLDEVRKTGKGIEYDITLYGGLGSFFYNLSYSKDDSGEVTGPDELTMNDLDYSYNGLSEPDLNFTINKEALFDAWNQICGVAGAVYDEKDVDRPNNWLYNDRWNVINFAPCYNGKPSDFDSSKVLLNLKGGKQDMPAGKDGYGVKDGWALGETYRDELTEWETKDIRSYLQRPVLNVKRAISAICNPVNNGGYYVDLDSHFFNPNNPYWENAWYTLPMLSDLAKDGQSITLKNASLAKKDLYHFDVKPEGVPSLSEYFNAKVGITVSFKPYNDITNTELHSSREWTGDTKGWSSRTYYDWQAGSVLVQLIAYDASHQVVGASDVYQLFEAFGSLTVGSAKANLNSFDLVKDLWNGVSGADANGVKRLQGKWKRQSDGRYTFSDGNGNPTVIGFTLNSDTPFASLEMKIVPAGYRKGRYADFWSRHTEEDRARGFSFYTFLTKYYKGNMPYPQVLNDGKVTGNLQYDIADFSLIGQDIEGLLSNTYVSRKDILSGIMSPCDFLLSYCKMFGLHFFKNADEESPDSSLYPSGVIHIMDRNTFYHRDNVVDLSDMIDRSKPMKLTPQVASSKWYDWYLEQAESEAEENYAKENGTQYGLERFNTGYNFDAGSKNLLEKVKFKAGIDVLEKDKYFQMADQYGRQAYLLNGFKYSLYKGSDTMTYDMGVIGIVRKSINPNNIDDADSFAKVQFHKAENEATDGSGVLLFLNGSSYRDDAPDYWLTDDVDTMVGLLKRVLRKRRKSLNLSLRIVFYTILCGMVQRFEIGLGRVLERILF